MQLTRATVGIYVMWCLTLNHFKLVVLPQSPIRNYYLLRLSGCTPHSVQQALNLNRLLLGAIVTRKMEQIGLSMPWPEGLRTLTSWLSWIGHDSWPFWGLTRSPIKAVPGLCQCSKIMQSVTFMYFRFFFSFSNIKTSENYRTVQDIWSSCTNARMRFS